jgi:hypothetical protein
MKYRIQYIKKGRRYDFVVDFATETYRDKKLLQYKRNSINFKMRKIYD